ncbi:MAG: hypothetical protein HOP29_07025 [Phycisphaerales bacterium]|nr:hypothetical protein [Phycisphaerales bacterium]
MMRWRRWIGGVVGTIGLFGLQGCLPDEFFPNLLGSSISSVVGAVLSDLLNTFLPPV